jgi:hypothetical protein
MFSSQSEILIKFLLFVSNENFEKTVLCITLCLAPPPSTWMMIVDAHLAARLNAAFATRLDAHFVARLDTHFAARLGAHFVAHFDAHLAARLDGLDSTLIST